jgi:galactoside O-acetyltransferase
MSSFLSPEELSSIGFKFFGENVLISRFASIYGADKIIIGNNVRIDDFCILSGKISLGNHIHISAYTVLYGGEDGIVMEDYSSISARGTVYALTDDYSGKYMTNAMVDESVRCVKSGRVLIKKYSVIGASVVILPHVTLEEGVAVGACSLINKSCSEWSIYFGIPARKVKDRKKELLDLEKNFYNY